MQHQGIQLDGGQIASLRKRRALTQDELADQAGISRNTVRQAEAGRHIALRSWRSLAAALGVANRTLLPKGEA